MDWSGPKIYSWLVRYFFVLKIGMGGSTKEGSTKEGSTKEGSTKEGSTKEGSEKKKKKSKNKIFLHFYLSLLNEKQVCLFFWLFYLDLPYILD